MASTLTSNQVASTYPVKGHGLAGNLKAVTGSYALAAALVLDDVIQMVKVPAGATVLDVILVVPDLDTNGSPAIKLDVGYGGDDDYFIAATTTGQAAGMARGSAATMAPLTLSSEDTIDIHVDTAPATGATSGTLYLTVFYSMP